MGAKGILRWALLFTLHTILAGADAGAQNMPAPEPGIAWQVKGTWQIAGKGLPLHTGDAIFPASLLQPDAVAAPHTMIVLLPDGQRLLYECFTVQDCARGFRVPSLYRTPEPFAVNMLSRIRTMLVRGSKGLSSAADIHPPVGSPRDEVVAVLDTKSQVQIEGLADKLANGRYVYNLRPLDPGQPSQLQRPLQKTEAGLILPLPSAGLYVVTISDETNTPRIQIFLAAVTPAKEASVRKSFHDAKAMMQQWNENYYGWPIHDFVWEYLQALTLGLSPAPVANAQLAGSELRAPDVTPEPTFSPEPGLLAGDTEVSLRCAVTGATIHYTVDTSQPVMGSSVYHAPIVVKRTELTIKAFATLPGKKDSAVVTGIFRIQQPKQEPTAAR